MRPESISSPDATEIRPVPNPDDLRRYRGSSKEQERIGDLFSLMPKRGEAALDIGARDGFLSLMLTERFASVTALDLELPNIEHPSVQCVRGDVGALDMPANRFDLVLCAEVLEHLPPEMLARACKELSRVSREWVLIGVPYRQDLRYGRTVCAQCNRINPPYGHVNAFDEERLTSLFPDLSVEKITFVGQTGERTNRLSAFLMDLAGNPYGTYDQEEGCVDCGARLRAPKSRGLGGRAAAFAAHHVRDLVNRFRTQDPNWIHMLFRKPA
jgi:hypothetical protein